MAVQDIGDCVTPNIIPIMVAINNAIYNAVSVRVDSLPVDQEQILWGLQQAKKN